MMNPEKIVHQPCLSEDCQSSDACTYFPKEDGTIVWSCFSCGGKGSTSVNAKNTNYQKTKGIDGLRWKKRFSKGREWVWLNEKDLPELHDPEQKIRGLIPLSLKKYGIKVDDQNNIYFPDPGDKFFGQDAFGQGSAKRITVVSGMLDAPSAYQLSGSFPAVSADSDSTALKQCKKNFDYLNSFEEIVFAFDNDKPGQEAQKACADLFIGKAKVMSLSYKDANQYLTETQNGKDRWKSDFFQASLVKPEGILAGTELIDLLLNKPKVESNPWPWDGLNRKTNGWRLGEMIAIGAGTGQGKTLFMTHIADHILKTTDYNIGVIFLEDPNIAAAERFVSVRGQHPYHLVSIDGEPDYPFLKEDYQAQAKETIGSGRVFFHNNEDFGTKFDVCQRIQAFVGAFDCRVIFLDHISFLVGIDATEGDERRKLDQLATQLKELTVKHNITLFVNAHFKRLPGTPHEEGAEASLADFRSSGAIAQLANTALGLERNQQAEDINERSLTMVRSMKCRFTGRTGLASTLKYQEFPYTWSEVDDNT